MNIQWHFSWNQIKSNALDLDENGIYFLKSQTKLNTNAIKPDKQLKDEIIFKSGRSTYKIN